MLRIRPITVLFVVALILFCVPLVLAEDASTCLGAAERKCYAVNSANFGTPNQPRNGLLGTPWLATTDEQMADRFNDVATGVVAGRYDKGIFVQINCPTAGGYSSCNTTEIEFDSQGAVAGIRSASIQAPSVGVPLPFSYVLIGVLLLGAALLIFGAILRRNPRAVRP